MKKIDQMKIYCANFDELKAKSNEKTQIIAKNRVQINNLIENCMKMNNKTRVAAAFVAASAKPT